MSVTKRIVASLALVLCMCAAPASSPANYNAFGITALQQLTAQSNTENVFISPVSIGVALSMAAEGAKGATRDQIIHALHVHGADLNGTNAALMADLTQNTDASVGLADAVWTRSDVKPRPEYLAALQQHYRAQAQALKFGDPSAARTINDWTKAHTLGLIDRIVDQTSPSDFLYLTNALAFKGTWTQQFKKSRTHAAPFTNADGSKSAVQMMSEDGEFETADASHYRVLRVPYGHGGYAAYILLPSGNDAEPLIKGLSAGGFDQMIRGLQTSYMDISLPRFTARYAQDLIPLLKSMGITDAFTAQADFSGIHAVPPSLAISAVNHATYVRVDEEGTTAAAATSVGITMTAIRIPQKTFVVDHPFVLALRDERTGSLLFIGAIRTLKA